MVVSCLLGLPTINCGTIAEDDGAAFFVLSTGPGQYRSPIVSVLFVAQIFTNSVRNHKNRIVYINNRLSQRIE